MTFGSLAKGLGAGVGYAQDAGVEGRRQLFRAMNTTAALLTAPPRDGRSWAALDVPAKREGGSSSFVR